MTYPDWLRYGNLGLAFLLELAALIAFAAAGALAPEGWTQLAVGAAGLVLFVVFWGLFAAPRSQWRLKGNALLAFKVGVFAVAAAIVVALGQPVWAAVLVVLVAVNLTLARVMARGTRRKV